MKKNMIFWIIGLFWLVIILVFVGIKEYTLQTGTEAILKTRPVDPKDMFRGDYVILSYEISTVDVSHYSVDASQLKEGEYLYVILSMNPLTKVASVQQVSLDKPSDSLFLRGKIIRAAGSSLTLEYGIESYFVPEGKGYVIEQAARQDLSVKVLIDNSGSAAIKDVLIDGKPVRFE